MEARILNILLLGTLQLTQFKCTASYETSGSPAVIQPTPVFSQGVISSIAPTPSTETFNQSTAFTTMPTAALSEEEVTKSDVITRAKKVMPNATSTTTFENSFEPTPTLSGTFPQKSMSSIIGTIDGNNLPNISVNDFVQFVSEGFEDESDDSDKNNSTFSANISNTSFTPFVKSDFFSPYSRATQITSSPTETPYLTSTNFNYTLKEEESTENVVRNDTSLQFIMTFKGACSQDSTGNFFEGNNFEDAIENATGLKEGKIIVIASSDICNRALIEIPITIHGDSESNDYVLERLNNLIGKLNISKESDNKTQVLTLVSVQASPNTTGEDVEHAKPSFWADFLPYIVIGGVFGGILLIVLILIMCKCFCTKRKHKKRPDFDIPHLSLRPEDYILTRIPRPTTIYADNMSSPIVHDDGSLSSGHACYDGDHRQSFETSVVPIEEAMRIDDPYLRYKLHEYHQDDRNSDLRTFNGKRLRHRATETDDDMLYRDSHHLGSTDKIHRCSRDMMGIDNQAYMRA